MWCFTKIRSKILAGWLACILLAGCGSSSGFVSDPEGSGAPAPVEPRARAPRALDDQIWATERQPVTFPLLDNDEVNEARITDLPAADQAHGTVSISPDGVLTYTPKPLDQIQAIAAPRALAMTIRTPSPTRCPIPKAPLRRRFRSTLRRPSMSTIRLAREGTDPSPTPSTRWPRRSRRRGASRLSSSSAAGRTTPAAWATLTR